MIQAGTCLNGAGENAGGYTFAPPQEQQGDANKDSLTATFVNRENPENARSGNGGSAQETGPKPYLRTDCLADYCLPRSRGHDPSPGRQESSCRQSGPSVEVLFHGAGPRRLWSRAVTGDSTAIPLHKSGCRFLSAATIHAHAAREGGTMNHFRLTAPTSDVGVGDVNLP